MSRDYQGDYHSLLVIFIRRLMILRLLTVGISTMTNLKAGYHEHLTRPGVKYDEEMSICLLESDPKMSRSLANVVSFEENFFVDLSKLI